MVVHLSLNVFLIDFIYGKVETKIIIIIVIIIIIITIVSYYVLILKTL